VDPNCPRCAELRQRIEKLEQHNALLRQRNRVLIRRVRSLQSERQRQQAFRRRAEDRVAELEERTRTNASNSHLPPSANPIGAKPPTAKRPTGRRRGAQPGHRGHGRKLLPIEQVDQRVEHRPQQCQACGAGLVGVAGTLVGRHQVAELPPRAVTLIEHQSFACRCPICGVVTRERIPAADRASACGPRLSAAIALLSCDVHGARRAVARAVARAVGRMPGCPIALGSVSAREAELAAALSEPYQRLVDQAADRPVKYLDETAWFRRGTPNWLFVAATRGEAVFRIERTRTRASLEQLLGGKPPRHACCSDRAGLYDLLPARRRQLCWAHLKRATSSAARNAGAQVRRSATLACASRRACSRCGGTFAPDA
jgi:transposase